MKRVSLVLLSAVMLTAILSLTACEPMASDYGTSANAQAETVSSKPIINYDKVRRPSIMSDDKIMAKYLDISLFDEENYSDIYLGKKFKFNITFAGKSFTIPSTVAKLKENGWSLTDAAGYDEESQVYACDTVEAVFTNENGVGISAKFFNSSNSSVKLKDCSIVKFGITNDFYSNPESYNEFNVNGINNKMAITDIIDTLGMPSHFYGISEDNYYLDYFITEKDRRNGITVHIDPTNDSVTAVEFSYYE